MSEKTTLKGEKTKRKKNYQCKRTTHTRAKSLSSYLRRIALEMTCHNVFTFLLVNLKFYG